MYQEQLAALPADKTLQQNQQALGRTSKPVLIVLPEKFEGLAYCGTNGTFSSHTNQILTGRRVPGAHFL